MNSIMKVKMIVINFYYLRMILILLIEFMLEVFERYENVYSETQNMPKWKSGMMIKVGKTYIKRSKILE